MQRYLFDQIRSRRIIAIQSAEQIALGPYDAFIQSPIQPFIFSRYVGYGENTIMTGDYVLHYSIAAIRRTIIDYEPFEMFLFGLIPQRSISRINRFLSIVKRSKDGYHNWINGCIMVLTNNLHNDPSRLKSNFTIAIIFLKKTQ